MVKQIVFLVGIVTSFSRVTFVLSVKQFELKAFVLVVKCDCKQLDENSWYSRGIFVLVVKPVFLFLAFLHCFK